MICQACHNDNPDQLVKVWDRNNIQIYLCKEGCGCQKNPFKLIQAWCPHNGVGCEFHSYPQNGECSCGEYKHHVHCQHGYIIQTG